MFYSPQKGRRKDLMVCRPTIHYELIYMGEYGIFQEEATLDTIGVDPDCQHKGIGKQLIKEFMDHLRELGVQKIHTLVDWNDSKLIQFFRANQFSPSKIINLERSL